MTRPPNPPFRSLNPSLGRTLLWALLPLTLMTAPAVGQVPIVQPGAPGEPSRRISVEEASDLAGLRYSEADVRFLQGMISHHAQALEMAELVPSRSNREAMELLAQRVALSQEDEIEMMQGWLEERGLPQPAADAHHAHDYEAMPGMASPEEMAQLAAAEGFDFDALFLRLMIAHHEGALEMVENLLDQPGSAQDSVLYAFTTEVTSDQSSEIERMNAMLAGFSPDPRVNLAAGFEDAGQAAYNLELMAALPKPDGFFDPENPGGLPMEAEQDAETDEEEESEEPRPSLLDFANTDIVFAGDVMVAGNYHGFNTYDISDPASPRLLSSVVCPGGQGDVSIVGDLLIMSVEQTRGRLDCGLQGVAEPVSDERFRGIRIFDVSDFEFPVQVGAVQTCRGSHTHTVVTHPDDSGNIYVYGSGTGSVRDADELEGCSADNPFEDPDTALFRIEVIRIPVDDPAAAEIINRPFIFSDPESGVLAGLWEGGDHGEGTQETRQTNQCHDITTFPAAGVAAGACSGNGILLDISDPVNPVRLHEVVDSGFAYWHSATFNNAGDKVIFTDEWGGGGRPRCRAQDPMTWGGNAIYDIVDGRMEYRAHYKLPAPQSDTENCVAHNGSLIPVPGRDIFVQSWYQGGISVMDFTDSSNPVEIAFFDRGPLHEEELVMGGYWSSYWYKGHIYGTEIARGLDVFALTPSDYLSENEIAAAGLAEGELAFNPQRQVQLSWPSVPVVARAYLDQLQRREVIGVDRAEAVSDALDRAERNRRRDREEVAEELQQLAASLQADSANYSGQSAARYAALADTLDGIAAGLQ